MSVLDDLMTERFGSIRDLVAERHGAPALVTEVVCRNCGHLLIKNIAGFWVHLESSGCSRPTFDIAEVAK